MAEVQTHPLYSMLLSNRVSHKNSDKKYFDSAEWAVSKQVDSPLHPTMTADAKKILAKKKLNKSRKYFDSGDWVVEKNGYKPSLLDHVECFHKPPTTESNKTDS